MAKTLLIQVKAWKKWRDSFI